MLGHRAIAGEDDLTDRVGAVADRLDATSLLETVAATDEATGRRSRDQEHRRAVFADRRLEGDRQRRALADFDDLAGAFGIERDQLQIRLARGACVVIAGDVEAVEAVTGRRAGGAAGDGQHVRVEQREVERIGDGALLDADAPLAAFVDDQQRGVATLDLDQVVGVFGGLEIEGAAAPALQSRADHRMDRSFEDIPGDYCADRHCGVLGRGCQFSPEDRAFDQRRADREFGEIDRADPTDRDPDPFAVDPRRQMRLVGYFGRPIAVARAGYDRESRGAEAEPRRIELVIGAEAEHIGRPAPRRRGDPLKRCAAQRQAQADLGAGLSERLGAADVKGVVQAGLAAERIIRLVGNDRRGDRDRVIFDRGQFGPARGGAALVVRAGA